MVSFEAPINKALIALVIVILFPLVMVQLNAMNTTGFTVTQLAIGTLIGVVVALGFVKLAMGGE